MLHVQQPHQCVGARLGPGMEMRQLLLRGAEKHSTSPKPTSGGLCSAADLQM